MIKETHAENERESKDPPMSVISESAMKKVESLVEACVESESKDELYEGGEGEEQTCAVEKRDTPSSDARLPNLDQALQERSIESVNTLP